MAKKEPKLYKSPAKQTFTLVNGILLRAGRPCTDEEKFILKSEALALKGTFLYKLLGERIADEMQKEIVENAKTMEDIYYFRAVLADRRMFMEEIENLSNIKVAVPPSRIQSPHLDGKKSKPS